MINDKIFLPLDGTSGGQRLRSNSATFHIYISSARWHERSAPALCSHAVPHCTLFIFLPLDGGVAGAWNHAVPHCTLLIFLRLDGGGGRCLESCCAALHITCTSTARWRGDQRLKSCCAAPHITYTHFYRQIVRVMPISARVGETGGTGETGPPPPGPHKCQFLERTERGPDIC